MVVHLPGADWDHIKVSRDHDSTPSKNRLHVYLCCSAGYASNCFTALCALSAHQVCSVVREGDRPSVGGLVRCERVQGAVMMVQNRYQRRRMYTRIALGKNRAMDVVSGETSGGSGQLLILYPLLFALQILQCWIGASGPRPASKGWSMPLLHIFCPFPF